MSNVGNEKPQGTLSNSSIAFGERLTCSVAEACEAVGLSRSKIYELISGGEVRSITIGRRRLISVPSLQQLTGCCSEQAANLQHE